MVTERQDHPGVPGPSVAAAAAGLMHSPAQWPAAYDRRVHARAMEENEMGMQQFRAACKGGKLGA